MVKKWFSKVGKIMLPVIAALAVIGVFLFAPVATNNVSAASATVPINMIYYGWHDATVEAAIVNAHPQYLVDNSPAGPWKGNANINTYTAAGIKYFEYIDGGYESTVFHTIPNDLQSNLNYITAAAAAGAYGVFLDEVSQNPSAASLYYLSQITAKAHSLGLKVVFNVGVDSWSDSLMAYCDFISSSELWNNAPLSSSQIKWASRTWLLSQNVTNSSTAAYLTNASKNGGINAHYSCTSYGALPSWLSSYVAQVTSSAQASAPAPIPGSANMVGTVVGTPVSTGATGEYSFNFQITSSPGSGVTAGQQIWCAATTTQFPNLLTPGAILTGNLDKSRGWWVITGASVSTNTLGTVVGTPVSTGATGEYSFNLQITGSPGSGVTAGQQIWCAATTTQFPNLLTPGVTLTGTLDKSLGWWVVK